jgi:hypothetical protein
MPNLGDKLRQIEAAEAEKKARMEASAKLTAESAEQKRRETVRQFFADAKRLTTESLR